jgi:hypothetical protein
MVRSLAVLLIPVVVLTYFFTRTSEPPVKVAVPGDWRATKVGWTQQGQGGLNGEPSPRNLWELGFLDATDTYVELDQGDLQSRDLVADKTRDGLPDGQSTVQGEVWERRVSSDDRTRSLVRATDALTTIVTGDVPYEDLESFAATLDAG